MLVSLDSESTGLDMRHLAVPFFVTVADETGAPPQFWEWSVDPLNRVPDINPEDVLIIRDIIENPNNILILQNAKFDVMGLTLIMPDLVWPWDRTWDTMLAGHILASNQPHNLTDMCMLWLGEDISKHENALKAAVTECRKMVKQAKMRARKANVKMAKEGLFGCKQEQLFDLSEPIAEWRIAEEDDPDMPSVSGSGKRGEDKPWRNDCWLPLAMANHLHKSANHPWRTVLSDYANIDSFYTLALWLKQRTEIQRRGYWEVFKATKQVLYPTHMLEKNGVTLDRNRLNELKKEHTKVAVAAEEVCINIAKSMNYSLKLPKGARNDNLTEFAFQVLKLPVVAKTDTGNPSLNKESFDIWLDTLSQESLEHSFVRNLVTKNQRGTAVSYMENYERFALPLEESEYAEDGQQFDTARTKSAPQIPEEGGQKRGVLDMDSTKEQRGLWKNDSTGRGVSSSSQLSNTSGGNTSGDKSPTHLRQSSMCEPIASISRDRQRQCEGQSSQGETSKNNSNGGPSKKDETAIRQGKQNTGECSTGKGIQSIAGSSLTNCTQDSMVTRRMMILYPFVNPCGSDTLRFSSYSPNAQNLSKKELVDVQGQNARSLRYIFGPAPNREWWKFDAQNIELRLPAYLSGEKKLIELFERPNDPPFYGSMHLLYFSIVYPDIWDKMVAKVGIEKAGPECKKRYDATWYQWCKNGDFAIQYGAGTKTADRAYHRDGSHARIKSKLLALETLNRATIRFANKHGYVETIPDQSVDPDRGYPLMVTRTDRGSVLETIPLNYKIQGSAMWWTRKAMVRTQEQLDQWSKQGFDGKMVLQVHDELVFDFPKHGDPKNDVGKLFRTSNLWRAQKIKQLMEKGGDDYSIPTPVSMSYCQNNFAEGVTF